MWRSKDMTAQEIAEFRGVFRAVYELTILNSDMALFLHADHDEPDGTLLMTGYQSVFLEMSTGGGWRTAEPPQGNGWTLLEGDKGHVPRLSEAMRVEELA